VIEAANGEADDDADDNGDDDDEARERCSRLRRLR
jgi:hypothetical protein